jgi:hypothetical protein
VIRIEQIRKKSRYSGNISPELLPWIGFYGFTIVKYLQYDAYAAGEFMAREAA